jgi:transposase
VILTGQKNEEAVCLIGGAGARLPFLQPYSPDLKPLEMEFAKAKELLRRAPNRRRLWDLMGRTLNMFTPEECANYVSHCG